MAIKKTQLYRSLWQSCDELRGGMDASQYKDYILTLLFVKYISDKYAGDPDGVILVPEGGSFADMVQLKGDKEIGDKINKIIGNLAEENELKGVIDVADFNDEDKLGKGKDMVDKLTKLIAIFEGLELGKNQAQGDDLLGDAYEFLMRHFATESGKSKGQFYTPAEVSRILAKVVGITADTSQDETVYDPACGSGSLLLKVADEAPRGLSIYGQEMDNSTAALARMNMILHDNPTAEIWQDNTLSAPHWKSDTGGLETFNFAVANPPFSYKSWSNGINLVKDEFGRFEHGTPPAKNGDYAFLLHILKSLKSDGKAAVILPHGVLFRGNAEGAIREALLKQKVIKGIIGLPANLFYGTGIPACIIVIDKSVSQVETQNLAQNLAVGDRVETQNLASRNPVEQSTGVAGNERLAADEWAETENHLKERVVADEWAETENLPSLHGGGDGGYGIFMIDASRGFIKDGNKNRLRERDIHKIVDVFNGQQKVVRFSRFVPLAEIEQNGYNLNIPRYIDSSEPDDIHDLTAHLKGGMPQRDIDALGKYWSVFPTLRQMLFRPMAERPGYSEALVDAAEVKTTILNHPEFDTFKQEMMGRFAAWRAAHTPRLLGLAQGDEVKGLIDGLAEDMLARFTADSKAGEPLHDRYAMYQILLDYWLETMQDDAYLITQDGWAAGNQLRELVVQKGQKLKETPDLVLGKKKYKADLIPPTLIVARFFAAEQAEIERLQGEQDHLKQEIDGLHEEHGGDEGLLAEVLTDSGKLSKGNVTKRLKVLKNEPNDDEEKQLLTKLAQLMDNEGKAGKAVKVAQKGLDEAVFAKYPTLTVAEIQTLVLDDKWMATLETAVAVETQNIASLLTSRVQVLTKRYSHPLPQVISNLNEVSDRVDQHLKKMGVL